ncbi:WXG100 family type VII secretion target [Nocardia sp. BMG111209]|uniref:WXG100 family type VII secretion target n=1 Tax=Nocardia sp. BMG111209 TaxID=1160137 RepID=UPI0003753B73|nr:WXG100 family type VII secretion target [Nocardia sp. BMG111209]
MGGLEGDAAESDDSGGAVEVVPDAVRAVAGLISQAETELRSALDSVDGEVNSLLQSNWSGPAATRFTQGWTETRDSGSEILSALAELVAALGGAVGAYESTEGASTTRLSSLKL